LCGILSTPLESSYLKIKIGAIASFNGLLSLLCFNSSIVLLTDRIYDMKNKIIALLGATLMTVACDTDSQDVTMHAAAGTAGDFKANIKDRVFFNFNQHDVDAKSKKVLEKQADWLKTYQATKAVVEGHADARGTREYNLALGNKRAESAKKELVKLGVTADRLKTISYGKERPQVPGETELAYAQNRTAITVVE
jgi:peptidoglycan-associated lipoprotein